MQHKLTKPLIAGFPGRRFLDAHLILTAKWHPDRQLAPQKFIYRIFEEYPLMLKDTPSRRHPQCDVMLSVAFFRKAYLYRDMQHILVEIKEKREDIQRFQPSKYNDMADFYYLAVVPELLDVALKKAEDNPTMGVFDVTTGRIHRLAEYTGNPELQSFHTQYSMAHYERFPSPITCCLAGPSFGYFEPKYSCDDADAEYNKMRYAFRNEMCKLCKEITGSEALQIYYSHLEELKRKVRQDTERSSDTTDNESEKQTDIVSSTAVA